MLAAVAETDSVIELARGSLAYLREHRGKGGQWVKGVGGSPAARAANIRAKAAIATPNPPSLSAAAGGGVLGPVSTRMNEQVSTQIAAHVASDVATKVATDKAQEIAIANAQKQLAETMEEVKKLQAEVSADEDKVDAGKHKYAFVSHMAWIAAGAVLSAAEAKGLSGIGMLAAQAGTVVGAGFGQEMIDLAKRL